MKFFILGVFVALAIAICFTTLKADNGIEILYFYSNSCHWCEKLDKELEGQVVTKIILSDPKARKLGVRVVPTLVFFKGGKEVERVVGYIPLDKFLGIVEKLS